MFWRVQLSMYSMQDLSSGSNQVCLILRQGSISWLCTLSGRFFIFPGILTVSILYSETNSIWFTLFSCSFCEIFIFILVFNN